MKQVALPSAEHESVAEAESMATLSNHPNVCRYHASWVETTTECSASDGSDSDSNDETESEDTGSVSASSASLYIQMELCGGLTLQEYLQ